MSGLLRKLAIWICCPIYKLIPDIYKMFFTFANGRFFTDEVISQLSQNIYVLVSVVMLFAFSVTILSAIVNPDLLSDKKKGVAGVFKRAIFGLILIVMVPIAFDEAYSIQATIMEKGLIEKIIVGVSYEDETGGNGGQVIAGTLIGSILYPVEDNLEVEAIGNVGKDYATMVTRDINYINRVAEDINVTVEGKDEGVWASKSTKYAFEFNGLVALLAGGACCYILLLFSIDTAIRMVKLGFLELTAPISIVSYIAVGDDILKRWAKEVGKTFGEVFIRITAISFYIFLIAHLDDFMNRIQGGFITKVILIVGLLIFVKQIPEFINTIFGTNIKARGGIGGRLGEMAAVGDVAKNAWGKLTKAASTVALATAGIGAGVATLGLGGAAAAGVGYGLAHRGWKKGFGEGAWKDRPFGMVVRKVGAGLKSAGAFLGSGNPIKGIGEAKKAYEGTAVGQQSLSEAALRQKENRQERRKRRLEKALGGSDSPVDKVGALEDLAETDSEMTSKQKQYTKKKAKLDKIKQELESIKGNRDNIVSGIEKEMSNVSDNKNLYDALNELKGTFLKGDFNPEKFAVELKKLQDIGLSTGSAFNFSKNMDEIGNLLNSKDCALLQYRPELVKKDQNGNIVSINVQKELSEAERNINKDSRDTDAIYNDLEGKATAEAQEAMEYYITSLSDENAARIKAQKGAYKEATESDAGNPYGGKYNTESEFKYQDSSTPENGASSSNTSSGGETSETVQQRVERVANVHDAPTHEEHNTRYDDLVSAFGSDFGAGGENNNGTSSNAGSGGGGNSNPINNSGGNSSGGSSTPDMSSYFDGLAQTIKDTSKDTNDILNKQLNKQDEIAKSTSQGFSNLNSTLNDGFSRVHTDLNKVNNSIKDVNSSVDDLNTRVKSNLNNDSDDDYE